MIVIISDSNLFTYGSTSHKF